MDYLPRLDPELHEGVYAFVCVSDSELDRDLDVVATMREAEGLTLVLPESQAVQRGYDVAFRCRWITLRVDSSLEAVGLTAAFAGALAAESIACNVVAGTHHDHLFVPVDRADDAMRCLRELQRRAAGS